MLSERVSVLDHRLIHPFASVEFCDCSYVVTLDKFTLVPVWLPPKLGSNSHLSAPPKNYNVGQLCSGQRKGRFRTLCILHQHGLGSRRQKVLTIITVTRSDGRAVFKFKHRESEKLSSYLIQPRDITFVSEGNKRKARSIIQTNADVTTGG